MKKFYVTEKKRNWLCFRNVIRKSRVKQTGKSLFNAISSKQR